MIDFIRDWWGIILGALGLAAWVGKIQRDVEDLRGKTFVTKTDCDDRRAESEKLYNVQFASGNTQFKEIKEMLSKLQDSHNKVLEILLNRKD